MQGLTKAVQNFEAKRKISSGILDRNAKIAEQCILDDVVSL